MDWHLKTQEWFHQKLLSDRQRDNILNYEYRQTTSFRLLSWIWLGIFILCLGGISLAQAYATKIPVSIKLTGIGILICGGVIGITYACHRDRKVLMESALFFTFLVVGGGIGLIAQIFDIPMHSGWGLLLWAGISLIIVFLSERNLLSLLWIPLFLGGIIGYLHLELLLLFLADAPVMTVICLASGLFILLWVTGSGTHPFVMALNRWSLILFCLVLLLGENNIRQPVLSFFITIGFLLLLTGYAVRRHRTGTFNLALCLIALRLIGLYLDVPQTGTSLPFWLLGTGAAVLGITGFYSRHHKSTGK